MGHNGKIPYYDLYAPIGKNTKTYTVEEAMDIIYNGCSVFSNEMADFVRKAYESNWIDFHVRKGKFGVAVSQSII